MIHETFKEGFVKKGFSNGLELESELVELILKGVNLQHNNPQISRVDLVSKMLDGERKNLPAAYSFTELYLIQKASNAISETYGHSINAHRSGIRSELGPMHL